jgi:aspartate/methionine/tyrosine aminotransferase
VVNATLAGAKPVFVKLRSERGFIPDPAEIEQAITAKTKAMIVLTPNNPTGAVYPAEVLRQLLAVARRHNVTIISDETYESLVYEGEHVSFLAFPGARDHVVHISGFSKTYAMTGLRVGYLAAPREMLLQFLKYHHTVNISANVPAQMACAAAMQGPQDCVAEMRDEYRRRRDLLVPLLNDIPGIHCQVPRGAFFAFADIRELGIPSLDFVQYLVREAGVVLTNGSGFDYEGFVRISYAAQPAKIEEAMKRMKQAVLNLPAHMAKAAAGGQR